MGRVELRAKARASVNNSFLLAASSTGREAEMVAKEIISEDFWNEKYETAGTCLIHGDRECADYLQDDPCLDLIVEAEREMRKDPNNKNAMIYTERVEEFWNGYHRILEKRRK